jgi:general secretion pathway protein D
MNSLIGARSLRTLLVCAVLATPLPNRPAYAEEQRWQLAMNQAELRDIVEEISAILGTTVVLDPRS